MGSYFIQLLLTLPVVLIALTFHEFAHGFVAYKLGDPTAKAMGRLSLNPLKHLDPIGAICLLLFHFGWAKPVPINVMYFKKPKQGMALTALAGPASNLILGFFGCFIYRFSYHFLSQINYTSNFVYNLSSSWISFTFYFAWLNIALAIFNLFPIPPLDGSRIFLIWLPEKYYFKIMKYERDISIAFFIILLLDNRLLGGYIVSGLSKIVYLIFNSFNSLFNLLL